MIPEKLLEVLKHEGVVSIVTQGSDGPHVANTWNSYVKVTEEGRLLYPAGWMNQTEENVNRDSRVLLTFGSKEVEGTHGPGAGFLMKCQASFVTHSVDFEEMKSKFPWARAVVEIKIYSVKQTI